MVGTEALSGHWLVGASIDNLWSLSMAVHVEISLGPSISLVLLAMKVYVYFYPMGNIKLKPIARILVI